MKAPEIYSKTERSECESRKSPEEPCQVTDAPRYTHTLPEATS